jgi:hypothetical protein
VPDDDASAAIQAAESDGEPRPLALLNQHIGGATYISSTYTSLLMCMGLVRGDEANEVLVPFVEMKFKGPEREDGTGPVELFSQILTLDNAAYVLGDIFSDMATVCRQFRSISSGDTALEMTRLEATKLFLSEAKASLETCIAELDSIRRPTR